MVAHPSPRGDCAGTRSPTDSVSLVDGPVQPLREERDLFLDGRFGRCAGCELVVVFCEVCSSVHARCSACAERRRLETHRAANRRWARSPAGRERVLAHGGLPITKHAQRGRLVDPYVPFIEETLAKYPRLRASRLWGMVVARVYTGSKSGFRAIVSRLRPRRAFAALTAATAPALDPRFRQCAPRNRT